MSDPLVTIFIPTYKRPYMLKKAIKSCQNQTVQNIRIIVSDNASNDDTFEVVRQLAKTDDRIHYICHSTNMGMLNNYQYGLSTIKTEFFSFLSDDDILLPHFCELALKGFLTFPDIAFFACSTAIISDKKGLSKVPLDLWSREGYYLPVEAISEMLRDKYPVPTTVLFKTQLVSSATIDFDNQVLWDCDFLIQLAAQFPIAISKTICGIFLKHGGSFSGDQSFLKPLQRLANRVENFFWMEATVKKSAFEQLRVEANKIFFRSIVSDLLHQRYALAKAASYSALNEKFSFQHLLIWASVHIFSAIPFLNYFLIFLKKIRDRNQKENWSGYEEYKNLVNE